MTVRDFNLYDELLAFLGQADASLGDDPRALYAVFCRWRPRGETHLLETWNYPLSLGQALPTLPVWLTDALAVPLDLNDSYEQTCRDLRIPCMAPLVNWPGAIPG